MPAKLPVEEKKRRETERQKRYYRENRSKLITAANLYYQNNKSLVLDKQRASGRWKTEAHKERKRLWYMQNKEREKEKRALYYATTYRRRMRELYMLNKNNPSLAENREKKKIYLKDYHKKNRERFRGVFIVYSAKRRMKIKELIHPESKPKAIATFYALAKSKYNETGVKHHVDHIIPVCVGGWHHEGNLQILPMPINSTKRGDPFWTMSGYKSWRDVSELLWPDILKERYREILATEALKIA